VVDTSDDQNQKSPKPTMIPVKKLWQQDKNISTEEIAQVESVDKRVYIIVKLLMVIILYYVVIFM
jgi:hypothetical protein